MSSKVNQKSYLPERLLTIDQVASRLGVVKKTVERHIYKLRAKGLQQIPCGKRLVRFREESLNKMIRRAAEREEPLF